VVQEDILLKNGDSGDKVTELQKKLYNIGYDVSVDGSFGNQTSEALKTFQKTENITSSGSYDSLTDAALKAMKDTRSYTPPAQTPKPVTPAPVTPAPVTPAKQTSTIPNIKTDPGEAQQVIVVLAPSYGTISATFKTYEKVSGIWQLINSGGAVVGKAGFHDNRHEGDMSTPTGKYEIPFMFGNADDPGVKFKYVKVQVGDYWVSNKIIQEYNVWMHYDGTDADARFYDYEALWEQPLYKYAAVIDFNYGPKRVLGKGSAIFLHIAPYSGGGTAGCVGVSEGNLIAILKWLDPAKKPVIIMGVNGSI
jgi:L,D-peptidoglycan transpeptidase YkuD (ErfK/YbiS/YcfS/YnhG family)